MNKGCYIDGKCTCILFTIIMVNKKASKVKPISPKTLSRAIGGEILLASEHCDSNDGVLQWKPTAHSLWLGGTI